MFVVMNDINFTGIIVPNVSSFYSDGNILFINMLEFEKQTVKVLRYKNRNIMISDMECLGQEIRDYLTMSAFKDIEEQNKVGYLTDAVSNIQNSTEEDENEGEEELNKKIGFIS